MNGRLPWSAFGVFVCAFMKFLLKLKIPDTREEAPFSLSLVPIPMAQLEAIGACELPIGVTTVGFLRS
jgi:hypothetical protein